MTLIGPYISIIATSRNDGHGGNIMKRMRLFVNGLLTQSRQYKLPIELIIVEWNPPPDRPPLHEILPKPKKEDFLELRYIVVPNLIHKQYKRGKEIPLFQMIAKNVGIRRAKGEFIICTNIDLLYSDALFKILTKKELKKDTFYRANRCDVPDEIDPQWPLQRQLDWCQSHIIKRLGRDNRFKNGNLEQFGLNDKPWIKKWVFDKMLFFTKFLWPSEKREFYQVDTFACGDFTLMHRDLWAKIAGYVELDMYSIHIDSLALLNARALGIKQHVFNHSACTFHIDHPQGWETLSPLQKISWQEQRPGLSYDILFEVGLHLLKQRIQLDLNPPDWGFSEYEFQEYVFGQ